MTTNLGNIDRALRLSVGLLLIGAPIVDVPPIWDNAWFGYVSMAVGAVLFVTGTVRFCPLYRVLGLSTCKTS